MSGWKGVGETYLLGRYGRSSYISEHFWLIRSLGCKSSLSFDKQTESKE